MSRTRKGKPRCPEGHKCNWCGGKASANHRDARGATVEEFEDLDPNNPCDNGTCDECSRAGAAVSHTRK